MTASNCAACPRVNGSSAGISAAAKWVIIHKDKEAFMKEKILVVNDDAGIREMASFILQAKGYETFEADNGRAGIELAIQKKPDLILLDIMMPEMDGYEAISAIREMEEFGQLPIIALTAKAMKADLDHCIEVGASDYISKPLDINQLLSLLRVWLYRGEEGMD
jgi:two-component system chemotaxis sensor kinase CheA